MRRNISFETYRPVMREIILYGLIGSFSAASDSVTFYFLSRRCDVYLSNFISINVGIALSFTLNRTFTFHVKDKTRNRAACFFGIGYLGLLLSTGMLFLGVGLLHADKITVKVTSVFLVAAFQFVLNKWITFRK